MLFRKFAIDFAEKYRMPELELDPSAVHYIENYTFRGNVRQLRNLVEQMTVVERNRIVTVDKLAEYIPMDAHLPMVVNNQNTAKQNDFGSEREIMYKILFDMRNDINDLKSLTSELIKNKGTDLSSHEKNLINRIYTQDSQSSVNNPNSLLYFENKNAEVQNPTIISSPDDSYEDIEDIEIEENKPESLSLQNNEKDLIIKALEKHKGRRNKAADELGISQRTLYRKIKQYNLEE